MSAALSAGCLNDAASAIASLRNEIAADYQSRAHTIPEPHSGSRFKCAAVGHAIKANRRERAFRPQVFQAATQITARTQAGWEQSPEITDLWLQLANALLPFSEHPTKPVAALIVGADGGLQAFGTNRVPAGIIRRGVHYVRDIRKDFIMCAERIALLEAMEIKPHSCTAMSKRDRYAAAKPNIAMLNNNLVKAGRDTDRLKGAIIITTAALCDICARVLAPFRPHAVIAGADGGQFTRATRNLNARQWLQAAGIAVIDTP